MPLRTLGRTGFETSVIGMGLAPLGLGGYSSEEFEATTSTAIAEGVNYFDVQPNYGQAESYFAPILRRYRERIFIVTKTLETHRDSALRALTASLGQLAVPRVDAIFINNIGMYDLDQLFKPDGVLAALKELRRRGKTRFLGLSGHMGASHFVKALETGEFDIVMAPFNFVDRHTYSFERDILPVAAKHEVGVVGMKVLGGAVALNYETREQKAAISAVDHTRAIRYVLGLPGMCSVVIGCKNRAEVLSAVRVGREYQPLSAGELAALEVRGKQLAAQWGKHYPED
ncbi:MAG: aldo/keto reductase [Acidobacteriia bacterium]|nr:aldo/keto reductase [Terriglobia bacterium]